MRWMMATWTMISSLELWRKSGDSRCFPFVFFLSIIPFTCFVSYLRVHFLISLSCNVLLFPPVPYKSDFSNCRTGLSQILILVKRVRNSDRVSNHEQCPLILNYRGYSPGLLSHIFIVCNGKSETDCAGP